MKTGKITIGCIFSNNKETKRNFSKESENEFIKLKSEWRKIHG